MRGIGSKIARWTLYAAGAAAVVFGVLVWPARVTGVGGLHSIAGWLVIVSLWTLAGFAWRSGVSRAAVLFAIGWGLVAALGASAQFQLPAGGWR